MESIEIWKDVENYEGLYKISNYGRVKVLKKGVVWLANSIIQEGKYCYVCGVTYGLHRHH